jgi:hypothetical protein
MTGILRVTLLAALASASLPAVAVAQQASVDSLVRRIELLERTTVDLERRVRELEAHIRSEPPRDQPVPTSAKWRDLQNWRRLRRGMKMDEVRALLGEPDRVNALGGVSTYWLWDSGGGANVYFDGRSGRLEGWMEPSGEGIR